MPAFLLHGWMPDAYRAAPLPVLLVFSGVLAKVGAYGFLRVVLPLFPDATVEFQEAILVERSGTEDLREMGGMAMKAPVLAALFLIVTLATLAMPGSANFVGEFYILNGLFDSKIVFAFVAISGVAMSAYYALRLYQRTMHNRRPEGLESREIGWRDGIVLVPLVLCILGLALYPQLILKRTDKSVEARISAIEDQPPTRLVKR